MAKAKPLTGAQIAKALAKAEDGGAQLSRPQQDAARAHRNAEQAKRGAR